MPPYCQIQRIKALIEYDELPRIQIRIREADSEETQLLLLDEKYFKISFADNEVGFDRENATKMFHIFQRLHNKTQYEGTGIGLALCKKIVENHHGKIYAESNPSGATFFVLLP